MKKKKQKGIGIKVQTPSTLITRLPILLGQIKAGNNSIDLLNEIRQSFCLLYRNNVVSKDLYNRLLKYFCSKLKSTNA